MPSVRRILTSWSKGELSPLLEGGTDLAAYYEGAATIENFIILRQGGLRRRYGTRYIKEVKDSSKDTILIPFEFSVDDSYILEIGDQYLRVYKNKAAVLDGGSNHVEVGLPYLEEDIRYLHFTQSADILYVFNQIYQQRKIGRVSDTSWSSNLFNASPPPSFEANTDLATDLAPSANTGTGITFRAKDAFFLAADEGRRIVSGASTAIITNYVSTSEVVADILDAFTNTITAGPAALSSTGTTVTSVGHGAVAGKFARLTSGAQSGQIRRIASITDVDTFELDAAYGANQAGVTWEIVTAIPSGSWQLALSPQTTLDPNKRAPIGTTVTLAAGVAAFRSADVGKYIHIYGGVVRIDTFTSSTSVRGTLLSIMGDTTDANPAACPAGGWTLEISSWSATTGFPRTGEFFGGRLVQAATVSEPTVWWMSASDDFENYALGVTAEDAVAYLMASRQVNEIQWLADNRYLFLGTAGSEHRASGTGSDNAVIGGDQVPLVERLSREGCAPIQPVVDARQILFIDRSRRKVMAMNFNIDDDSFRPRELTVGSEHITESGVRNGPLAYEKRLDSRLYFNREDGELVAMTFFPEQKVNAFSRLTTGFVESVAVIANPDGGPDQIWLIVRRTINGQTKRYVEMIEPDHESLQSRNWTGLQTDCAIVYSGAPSLTVTGLDHLEGESVDVIIEHEFIGQKTVSGGAITLTEDDVDLTAASVYIEIGLHYDSTLETMRPSIPGEVIEGLPRSWNDLWLRLHQSVGGTVNGEPIQYPAGIMGTIEPFTGDVMVRPEGCDTDGRIRVVQDKPYPMTILSSFGTLTLGDHA